MYRCRGFVGPYPDAEFIIVQIKEKFGGLCFYWRLDRIQTIHLDIVGVGSFGITEGDRSPLFNAIAERVNRAGVESAESCSIRGVQAKLDDRGRIIPYCPTHWPRDCG